MDTRWRIVLLGGLQVEGGGRVLTHFRTQKAGVLLAYLAYHLERPHLREQLIEMLWPESELRAARNNLSKELYALRQELEPPGVRRGLVLAADRALVRLNPEVVTSDVVAFEAALKSAECSESPTERAAHLAEAVDGYGGELLPGYYADWVLQEREWLAERYFQALGQLLVHLEQAHELPRALEYARRGIRADPLREDAHRDLMRLFGAVGQPAAALRQYHELKRLLKQELGAEPAAATQALACEVQRLADRSPQFLPSSPIPEPPKTSDYPHNLPLQLTRFIGRESEIAEVKQLLATSRLVTLTGTGGCGKTRLALQVAADLLEAYADGVWLVELAALVDPALVSQTVASALGVREEPGRALLQTLSDYLRPKSLLLALDNCEHLLFGCPQVAESLLKACSKLRILATSREGLHIAGETTYRVPSLSLPDPNKLPSAELLLQFEAVRLFVDRAEAVVPTFSLTPQNAVAVAQVCCRLDGLPLAIELAAARVNALPLDQIAERLEDRFRLLTGGSRTALPRHQTLRALIDWSYHLLTESERMLLRRVSVFTGTWSLAAAEAVCAGDGIEEWEILDLLVALVEKSLVIYEEQNNEAQYRLLETVRQYARKHLGEAGEAELVRVRHRDWFLEWAERADAELIRPSQGEWLARLEQEHDNLRAALEGCLAHGEAEMGLRLGAALARFWEVRGYVGEGRERLARLLALPEARASTTARAKALNKAGLLALSHGNYEVARSLLEESQEISRELGDLRSIAELLTSQGMLAVRMGDREAARALLEESVMICRDVGEPRAIAMHLNSLGLVAMDQADYERAQAVFEESLVIRRQLGDTLSTWVPLVNVGIIASRQGNYSAAQDYYQQALAISLELEDQPGIASSLFCLGEVALLQENYATARPLYEQSLAIRREFGSKRVHLETLERLGTIARQQGDYEAARTLHEESLAISRELDNKEYIGCCLDSLGEVAQKQGDYEAARRLFEESLAIRREMNSQPGHVAFSLQRLGQLAQEQGQYETARALLEESVTIHREMGDRRGMGDRAALAYSLQSLAGLAAAGEDQERAARLLGAVGALREGLYHLVDLTDRADYERTVATVRTALGEATFAAAWAVGRAMSLGEAVAYALDETGAGSSAG